LYSEIIQLKEFVVRNACKCVVIAGQHDNFGHLVASDFYIKKLHFKLNLDDEYNDSALNNPLLNVALALRSLGHLHDAPDFLVWCNQLNLNPAISGLLDYYKEAIAFCLPKSAFSKNGEVVSFISDLDFELNSGAAQYLRKH